MGFEVVVRPAVFPNIRPQRPGLSMPGDAPDKGFATISGGGATFLSLPWSESMSMSKGHHERRRQYQKVRIAATTEGKGSARSSAMSSAKSGEPDWSTYIEVEIAERMELDPNFEMEFDKVKPADNMKLLGSFTRNASG